MTSGCVFTLGGGVVAWKPTKQTIISWSTMKFEFIALYLTCVEVEGLWSLLIDMPLLDKLIHTMCIHYDNQATIAKAKSTNLNEKRRHKNMT